jgi:hypothetical protein
MEPREIPGRRRTKAGGGGGDYPGSERRRRGRRGAQGWQAPCRLHLRCCCCHLIRTPFAGPDGAFAPMGGRRASGAKSGARSAHASLCLSPVSAPPPRETMLGAGVSCVRPSLPDVGSSISEPAIPVGGCYVGLISFTCQQQRAELKSLACQVRQAWSCMRSTLPLHRLLPLYVAVPFCLDKMKRPECRVFSQKGGRGRGGGYCRGN